ALVVVGLVEAKAGARCHAYAVERHESEQERAGRVTGAVDDNALALGLHARIFRLVLVDQPAEIARDAQLGGGRHRQDEEKNETEPAHASPIASFRKQILPCWRQKLVRSSRVWVSSRVSVKAG